jgi:hypothetical protein
LKLGDKRGFLGFDEFVYKFKESDFNCGYGLDEVLVVEVEFEEFMMEIFVLLLFFQYEEILVG